MNSTVVSFFFTDILFGRDLPITIALTKPSSETKLNMIIMANPNKALISLLSGVLTLYRNPLA